jgi:hypothetical protein
VLPFGPLRRPLSMLRPGVSLPRSKSFERMMTNDRQPPPTPLAHKSRSSGSLRQRRHATILGYLVHGRGLRCHDESESLMTNDQQAQPTPVAHRCHSLSSRSLTDDRHALPTPVAHRCHSLSRNIIIFRSLYLSQRRLATIIG